MRIVYVPHNQKVWEHIFKLQAAQSGHGMVGFRGTPYQRGAGFGALFGGLLRSILPVAKTIGKTVGRQALRTGVEVAADALSGRNLGEALEERGKAGAVTLLAKGAKKLGGRKKKRKQQKGRGLGSRPRNKKTKSPPSLPRATGGRRRVSRAKHTRSDQLGLILS